MMRQTVTFFSLIVLTFTSCSGSDGSNETETTDPHNEIERPVQMGLIGMGTDGLHGLQYLPGEKKVEYSISFFEEDTCAPKGAIIRDSIPAEEAELDQYFSLLGDEDVISYGAPMSEIDPWFEDQNLPCIELGRFASLPIPGSDQTNDLLPGRIGDDPTPKLIELETLLQDFFVRTDLENEATLPALPR